MGIFSFFQKKTPQEVYKDVADKIVFASLDYRTNLNEPNNKLSADAGAEYAYLLLNLVDRAAFQILGQNRRNEVSDEITNLVITLYSKAIFNQKTPKTVVSEQAVVMLNNMNERQVIYGQCKTLTGESFPNRGTMIFALAYFIHFAQRFPDIAKSQL